jgi:hypothetical protein
MKIIDRATRGTAARVHLGRPRRGVPDRICSSSAGQKVTALNEQVQSAEARVESNAKTTIADQAHRRYARGPITFDKKDFAIAVEGRHLHRPDRRAVRIWDKDGVLLASSDPSEVVGQLQVTEGRVTSTDALDRNDGVACGAGGLHDLDRGDLPRRRRKLLEVTTPFMVKDQVDPPAWCRWTCSTRSSRTAAANRVAHLVVDLRHRRARPPASCSSSRCAQSRSRRWRSSTRSRRSPEEADAEPVVAGRRRHPPRHRSSRRSS